MFLFQFQLTGDMPTVPQDLLWGFKACITLRWSVLTELALVVRDGWQALWGLGLACEAGPSVPGSHGVIWATL